MVTQELLMETAEELVRQKCIYQKALDQIDKYGNLIDMQATARQAIADASQPGVEADAVSCARCGRITQGDAYHEVCSFCVDRTA